MMYHNVISLKLDASSMGFMYLELWHQKKNYTEPILRSAIPWGYLQFEFFTVCGKMDYRGLS